MTGPETQVVFRAVAPDQRHRGATSVHEMKLLRLKTRAEFLAVAGERRKFVTPGLLLQARTRPDGEPGEARVGFTVSRKVGNAVVRNRAKRRLRALAREWLAVLATGGVDYVLIGRRETPVRPYEALVRDLRLALRKLRLEANGGIS